MLFLLVLLLLSLPLGAEENPVPKIPEPMIFDLMRPLHSRQGEVEINTLSVFSLRGHTRWAPEIELAIGDGLAVELEVPFSNLTKESLKGGLQYRIFHDSRNVHGVQFLAERSREFGFTDLYALYLYGHRFSERWSLFSMSGLKSTLNGPDHGTLWGVQNTSLFYDFTPKINLGVESNWNYSANRALEQLTLMPQLQYKWDQNWTVQVGAGATRSAHSLWEPILGLRVTVDLTPDP